MADRIHITTAIFYCNGIPHVGSAYEALAADVFARYQRRKLGRDNVTFLSGTDEHGDKIRRAALAEGLAPKAYTDKMSALFHEAFKGLNVDLNYWVRTTDPVHEKFVQEMLGRTHERGDIYFRDYEGLYCVDCERFYTEKELLPGNVCPTHNKPAELISEGNYFLKIEKYREQVRKYIADHPDFIRPERYRNEALNMLGEPLSDLCISRPKSRLDWGIELPFDSKYVTYVWYDAFWAYVREPVSYEKAFGPDVLRYFVMREVVYGLDGDFSEERLTERYNADLANDLGNFTSRVLTMAQRYLGGAMNTAPARDGEERDRVLAAAFLGLPERVGAMVDELALN